jgi:hypothetical protein
MGCTDAGRVSLGWDTISPSDDAPYTIDYTDLLPAGDTIQASTWQSPLLVDGGGSSSLVTHDPLIITPARLMTQVWIKSGASGQSYVLMNTITTASGAVFVRSFGVTVRCM